MCATSIRAQTVQLDETLAAHLSELALDCVHRPYPNKISHILIDDSDAKTPQQLTPVFYGCFDWHSAVHGHWLLVRLLRLYPDSAFSQNVQRALEESFQPDRVAAECAYLSVSERATFERPYGLAWLLQLMADLRSWDDARGQAWVAILAPLEKISADRIREWVPKLAYPIRTGEHSQTAFAFGLAYDWAVVSGDKAFAQMIRDKALEFHRSDVGCPMDYEPSGQDFLSPCLAVADLMRRFMSRTEYAAWLGAFMPNMPLDGRGDWLPLGVVTDPSDGKLAHLDGLNLSRAWMLKGMAAGLPETDPRRSVLLTEAQRHLVSGVQAVSAEHYEGGHWLGSFAVYALSTGL
ncbi:MAG: DUF2891 domain-containing protein [Acidobacteria bacterium]|nr:DUF2891 domain-containing protein [Acidobacteriota bacterium]